MAAKANVFIRYAPRDEPLLGELSDHLALLVSQGLIETWTPRTIDAGQDIEAQTREALERADIILLLVSSSFLASPYCAAEEWRKDAARARVIPIVVRPVDWKSAPFGGLQPLPRSAKAVTSWSDRDEAWTDVARGLREVVADPPPQRTSAPKPLERREDTAAIDFAVITAIEVERRAVCEAFGFGDDHRVRRGARVYWRGSVPLAKGGAYEVVVSQAPDMANVDAALLTADTLHDWKPGAAVMVGIAASTDPAKARLGDIVVGSEIYYYERGKVTPEGVVPEPKMVPADATLWSNVSALPVWNGDVPVRRPVNDSTLPAVHYGVIASGDKVLADESARDRIALAHRKILAIEMEGFGFSKAVWQSFDRVRHLVIRAICDDGSTQKDDRWHAYAAAAAAAFAKHLLRDRPLEPR